MARQKKGCGFLITSLVLFLVGGLAAALLGVGAFSKGKKVVDEISKTGTSFVTPESVTYEPREDSAVTVWLSGNVEDVDLEKVIIHITDTASKTESVASKPSGSNQMDNKHLVGSFEVKAGRTCQVRASGLEDGRHLTIASVSMSTAVSFFGMGLGIIGSLVIFGSLGLVCGIIGLVMYFGTQKTSAQGAPPA
ncbi:MAG: hypothetical protein ACPHVK_01900 [Akkermansiaceae bacterium]